MSFQVVDQKSSQLLWVPINDTAEIFAGQFVTWPVAGGDGVTTPGIAVGAFNTTTEEIIAGVVVTTNNRTKVFEDETTVANFAGEEITGVNTQADQNARNSFGHGGMYSKNDPQSLVQIAVCDATTRIRGRIYNGAYGTAITTLTNTVASATGVLVTHNNNDDAGDSDLSTIYCRTGANAGLYRVVSTAAIGTSTVTHAFPNAIAVGDTFVRVNLKQGFSQMQTDANNLYIDNGANPTDAYWGLMVDFLDLRTSGQEFCEFRFCPSHFTGVTS